MILIKTIPLRSIVCFTHTQANLRSVYQLVSRNKVFTLEATGIDEHAVHPEHGL